MDSERKRCSGRQFIADGGFCFEGAPNGWTGQHPVMVGNKVRKGIRRWPKRSIQSPEQAEQVNVGHGVAAQNPTRPGHLSRPRSLHGHGVVEAVPPGRMQR